MFGSREKKKKEKEANGIAEPRACIKWYLSATYTPHDTFFRESAGNTQQRVAAPATRWLDQRGVYVLIGLVFFVSRSGARERRSRELTYRAAYLPRRIEVGASLIQRYRFHVESLVGLRARLGTS